MIGDDQLDRLTLASDIDVRLRRPSIQLSYGCVAVHLADCPAMGNVRKRAFGVGARPERQRSHVRIVSGAPEKQVPSVPGLWRVDFPGRMALMPFKAVKFAAHILDRQVDA